MGVTDGQAVSAEVTNPAFLDKNVDTTAAGKVSLNNAADPTNSGAQVINAQANINGLASFSGAPINSGPNIKPTWGNNDVGSSTDSLRVRADALTQKFNSSSGHMHTGAAGDGPQLSGSAIQNVPLEGFFTQGIPLTATGGTTDVSTEFASAVASPGSTGLGVVVTAPYNRCILRNNSGATFTDGSGNEVYGRLTNSGSTWTVTYYSLVVGVETAYTGFSSTTVNWYYQQLYNPMVSTPVYSELAAVPSDAAAATVPAATQSIQGKTLLTSSNAQPVASASTVGTPNATVANADHVHEGVHSVMIDGLLTQLLGDVVLTPGANVTMAFVSGKLQIGVSISSTAPNVEYRTITSGEATAGQLTLAGLPAAAANTLVDLIGSCAQIYGVDFTVTGSVLSWVGLGLGSVLGTGDKLRIQYWS